jgi:hypothetical protein
VSWTVACFGFVRLIRPPQEWVRSQRAVRTGGDRRPHLVVGEGGGLAGVGHAELGQDSGDMDADGDAGEQLLGDLAVHPPSCHQDQHLGSLAGSGPRMHLGRELRALGRCPHDPPGAGAALGEQLDLTSQQRGPSATATKLTTT